MAGQLQRSGYRSGTGMQSHHPRGPAWIMCTDIVRHRPVCPGACSMCNYPPVSKLNMKHWQKKQASVQLTSTTKSDRRAMELYDHCVIYPAGITNLALLQQSHSTVTFLSSGFPFYNNYSTNYSLASQSAGIIRLYRYLKLLGLGHNHLNMYPVIM